MKFTQHLFLFITVGFFMTASVFSGGCAQVGMPTGGPKDTTAPKLIRATPADGSRNVSSPRITLDFNEYIDVQDLQNNLVVSPLQKKMPAIIINTRSIGIKFRDTLLPNTTYTINFGNAVKDINEGNVYKDLSYTFSTGSTLDSLTLSGIVLQAETGTVDSSLLVMLYRNAADSTVKTIRPNYIAKINGDGSFRFDHLPAAAFKIYALKDADGGKTYNSLSETFAFTNADVHPETDNGITLYAYAQEKPAENKKTPSLKPAAEKKLRANVNLTGPQDLFRPLEIDFSAPLKFADSNRIYLTDTLFNKIPGVHFSMDSTAKKIFLNYSWKPAMHLVFLMEKDAVKDSANNTLAKNDTLRFTTKTTEDYGKLVLRFTGLDLQKHPVLEFVTGEEILFAYPLTGDEWHSDMFLPGQYDIRILYDTDQNGKWTPGNYSKKLQPELNITLPQKLSVRADWDNEREISL